MNPRSGRTRTNILKAFNRLALAGRYDSIRAADLIAASGVARSTFYEHFRGKDDVLLAAMEPILQPLAASALGRATRDQLRTALDHLWEQRGAARLILNSRAAPRLQRQLATMIQARLETPDKIPTAVIATGAAAARLAALRAWLSGEVSCPASVLAEAMLRI